jgi:hypothetical protein
MRFDALRQKMRELDLLSDSLGPAEELLQNRLADPVAYDDELSTKYQHLRHDIPW